MRATQFAEHRTQTSMGSIFPLMGTVISQMWNNGVQYKFNLSHLHHCTVYNQDTSGGIFTGDFMRKKHAGTGIQTHNLPTRWHLLQLVPILTVLWPPSVQNSSSPFKLPVPWDPYLWSGRQQVQRNSSHALPGSVRQERVGAHGLATGLSYRA